MSLTITPATTPEDMAEIKKLILEYQEWLDVDLCFQGFEQELNSLADKYDCLLLARWNGEICGGVGMWSLPPQGMCEMKRLFVRDAYKGKGIGRKLALEIMKRSKEAGYSDMCLDTLERLAPAIKLYETLGFEKCAPYYDNPLENVVYMQAKL